MAQSTERVLNRVENITKSQEDKRLYRGIELNNGTRNLAPISINQCHLFLCLVVGMKIFLVSDPQTDKSSAAMDVNVGFLSDPKDVKGLAHFCEHMLFLGTEKYPNENDYSKFLQEHGGSTNATTYMDHTMYYFDVIPSNLSDALER